MLLEAGDYVATSIANTLIPRMRRTHERRRIAVFSGPPGIGKSTAIERFRADEDPCVAVVAVPPGPRTGLKPVAALQLAIEALRGLDIHGDSGSRIPASYAEQRSAMFNMVCRWAGIDPYRVRRANDPVEAASLTIVFDEAQNLSREAIEALRFINDAKGGFSPFPLGLIFVGNNEFILKSDRFGQSALSDAVADRALFSEAYAYSDVTDDDLILFLEARGLTAPEALRLTVRYFASRTNRSFRRVSDLLDELMEEAEGAFITATIARIVLHPATPDSS
jgi:DNA transposition AAA+ family ATPase